MRNPLVREDSPHSPRPFAGTLLLAALLAILLGAAPAARATEGAEPIGIRFGRHDTFDRLVLDWPAPVHVTLVVGDATATLRFDRPATLDAERLNAVLPAEMRPATVVKDGTGLSFRVPPGKEVHDHSAGHLVVMDLLASVAPDAATPPPAAAPVIRAPVARPALRILRLTAADGVSLRFQGEAASSCAMFERGGYVWAIFDRPAALDLPAVEARASPAVQQIPHAFVTMLRIAIPPNSDPEPGRLDGDWTLKFRHGGSPDPSPAALTDRNGFYAVADAGHPIAFSDPDQGDLLIAVPMRALARAPALVTGRAGYRALPTLQGLVFVPENDQLRITIQPEGVMLSVLPGADR